MLKYKELRKEYFKVIIETEEDSRLNALLGLKDLIEDTREELLMRLWAAEGDARLYNEYEKQFDKIEALQERVMQEI